jgi:hypothetical protein
LEMDDGSLILKALDQSEQWKNAEKH